MKRVSTEKAKYSSEQQREKRRHPGGGAGVHAEWRAEAVASGEGVRDVAGLKQEGNYANALARMNVLELPHVAEA